MFTFFFSLFIASLIGLVIFFVVRVRAHEKAYYPQPSPPRPWYWIDYVGTIESILFFFQRVSFRLFVFSLRQTLRFYRWVMRHMRKHVRDRVYRILLSDRDLDNKIKTTQSESAFIETVRQYKNEKLNTDTT